MAINPVLLNLVPKYPSLGLSCDEIIAKIFAHEKEYRGIDWLQLHSQGPAGMLQAKQMAHAHLMQFQKQLDLMDDQIPTEIRSLLGSMKADEGVGVAYNTMASNGADVMPIWPMSDTYFAQWEVATGSDIKNLIAIQISAMQSIQTVHNDPSSIAEISLGIGIVAWVRTAWVAFQAMRAIAGATEAYAVLMGIIEATPAVITFAVTTVFLAALIPILLIMMKDATCYMVVLNKGPDDLIVEGDVDLTHGNLNVQFVDYVQNRRIPGMSVIYDPNNKPVATNYWGGIFVAQKKEAALFGSQGAFKFSATTSFPSGLHIGWEIPLTAAGGDNRCLVSADYNGDLGTFSNMTNDSGSGNSTSVIATGSIVARANSSGGSQGYMLVIASATQVGLPIKPSNTWCRLPASAGMILIEPVGTACVLKTFNVMLSSMCNGAAGAPIAIVFDRTVDGAGNSTFTVSQTSAVVGLNPSVYTTQNLALATPLPVKAGQVVGFANSGPETFFTNWVDGPAHHILWPSITAQPGFAVRLESGAAGVPVVADGWNFSATPDTVS